MKCCKKDDPALIDWVEDQYYGDSFPGPQVREHESYARQSVSCVLITPCLPPPSLLENTWLACSIAPGCDPPLQARPQRQDAGRQGVQ